MDPCTARFFVPFAMLILWYKSSLRSGVLNLALGSIYDPYA